MKFAVNVRRQRFIKAHPVAKSLTGEEIDFAIQLADRHENVRVYRSKGQVMLSRDAMWTPGVREAFYVTNGKEKDAQ